MNNVYYRISYLISHTQKIGIYEAIKQAIDIFQWRTLKANPSFNWLPIPNCKYMNTYQSYFTNLGYALFMQKTYSIACDYLEQEKIIIESFDVINGNIQYQDDYQIVVDISK